MNVLTVSQITTYIKAIFDENPAFRNIYISGEISNYTHYYRSGHLYMTLKDDKSQIKAVMFASSASRLKFEPENGMSVICRGRISVYDKNGEYQLYIDDMQPDGLGALNLAFEKLKEKLEKEGAFSQELKKEIPKFPKKIGVVTSNIGAAVEDIKNITARRWPAAELFIVPTIVQGDYAPADIVNSIKMLDERGDIDVMIVGRGGGSLEELWAFNTEEVARAVINCKTPVVSAVGHETDFTICDFVSDLRAPTPSAAAELVCPDSQTLMDYFSNMKKSIIMRAEAKVNDNMQYVSYLTDRGALSKAEEFFNSYTDEISRFKKLLKTAYIHKTEIETQRFSAYVGKLHVLSPLAVMARGFCSSSIDGTSISSAKQIKKDETIKVKFADGSADCKVLEVNINE
ncbi:MAG: exodeoxyribonuclease VII large subunit [Eubacterium sp.]|uniref:exodeoxyribonuclease VII large subunit n=1 Tax=Eubacterium sp. TaxID=142586 RepID=UPI003A205D5B